MYNHVWNINEEAASWPLPQVPGPNFPEQVSHSCAYCGVIVQKERPILKNKRQGKHFMAWSAIIIDLSRDMVQWFPFF